jgi:hypothetical protein
MQHMQQGLALTAGTIIPTSTPRAEQGQNVAMLTQAFGKLPSPSKTSEQVCHVLAYSLMDACTVNHVLMQSLMDACNMKGTGLGVYLEGACDQAE